MPLVSLTDPSAFLFPTAGKAPASPGENVALARQRLLSLLKKGVRPLKVKEFRFRSKSVVVPLPVGDVGLNTFLINMHPSEEKKTKTKQQLVQKRKSSYLHLAHRSYPTSNPNVNSCSVCK